MAASLRARARSYPPPTWPRCVSRWRKLPHWISFPRRCCSEKCFGKAIRTIPSSGLLRREIAGRLRRWSAWSNDGQRARRRCAGPDRGRGWFSKAAEDGDAGGMYALAECHLFGKGVPKDPKRAIELLTAASALNNPRAMNLLGDLYRKGVPGLLEPNLANLFGCSPGKRPRISGRAGQSRRALHLRSGCPKRCKEGVRAL